MKLKITAALLACSIVFSGCSVMSGIKDYSGNEMEVYSVNKENAFNILDSALKKYLTSTKREVKNEITMTVKTDTDGDISSKQTIDYTINEENASFGISIDYAGNTSETVGNYEDGCLYIDFDGMKTKTSYDFDEVVKTLDNIHMFKFDGDSVKESDIARNGKNYEISVAFDNEKIKSFLDTDLSEFRDFLALSAENTNVSGFTVNAEISPQYELKSLEIHAGFEISDNSKTIPLEFSLIMQVNSIGDDTPMPIGVENPDEYYDVSADAENPKE